MESELSQSKEIILLISRNPDNLHKPKHHLLVFDHSTIDIDSTKLYIYNGIWNKQHKEKGGHCNSQSTITIILKLKLSQYQLVQ